MGLAARIKAAPEAQRQLYTPPVPGISVGKWKAHAYYKAWAFCSFLGLSDSGRPERRGNDWACLATSGQADASPVASAVESALATIFRTVLPPPCRDGKGGFAFDSGVATGGVLPRSNSGWLT